MESQVAGWDDEFMLDEGEDAFSSIGTPRFCGREAGQVVGRCPPSMRCLIEILVH